MFKSGYVAILGRPNVGKSTLLNSFLGQKLAAVTPKPQTTRHRILGILHRPDAQLLFLDTPGIHKPHKSLNEYMVEIARATFDDADLFLLLVEPEAASEEEIDLLKSLQSRGKPILLLINKLDAVDRRRLLPLIASWTAQGVEDVIPISAKTGDGLPAVVEEIVKRLPEGPSYYPEDQITDQTERFLVSEIIREKVMELTLKEVPYSVTVQIESFEESPSITRIRAAIIAEKDSQKGILIGKGGQMIKKIGELSRKEIESILDTPIYLELFVRIEKDWSKDPKKVKELAYS